MIVKIDVRSFWMYDLRGQTYRIRSWLNICDHFAENLWSLDWRYMICKITGTLYFETVRSCRWKYAITYILLKFLEKLVPHRTRAEKSPKSQTAPHQHQTNPKYIAPTRTHRRARLVRGSLSLLSYSFSFLLEKSKLLRIEYFTFHNRMLYHAIDLRWVSN